jgi:hypothetical protein
MSCRLLSAIAFIFVASQIGCGSHQTETQNPLTTPRQARNTRIPAEVSYPVIKDEHDSIEPNYRRTVSVRLNMKVMPEVLREIALEVKTGVPEQYEQTLIFHYLPETIPGVPNEPWATTHFMPKLEVKILGLTIDQETALRKMSIPHPGKELGRWLIDWQYAGHVDCIYEDNGTVKLAMLGQRGDRLDLDLAELPSASGRRFKRAKGTDIFEIDVSGVLRIYGDEGRVFTAAMPMK